MKFMPKDLKEVGWVMLTTTAAANCPCSRRTTTYCLQSISMQWMGKSKLYYWPLGYITFFFLPIFCIPPLLRRYDELGLSGEPLLGPSVGVQVQSRACKELDSGREAGSPANMACRHGGPCQEVDEASLVLQEKGLEENEDLLPWLQYRALHLHMLWGLAWGPVMHCIDNE